MSIVYAADRYDVAVEPVSCVLRRMTGTQDDPPVDGRSRSAAYGSSSHNAVKLAREAERVGWSQCCGSR